MVGIDDFLLSRTAVRQKSERFRRVRRRSV